MTMRTAAPPHTAAGAMLQPFSRGFALWEQEGARGLALVEDGRLLATAADQGQPLLGEPVGPASPVRLHRLEAPEGTLLWTRPTGWLLLTQSAWHIPLPQR